MERCSSYIMKSKKQVTKPSTQHEPTYTQRERKAGKCIYKKH